jgi:hypothetical protein
MFAAQQYGILRGCEWPSELSSGLAVAAAWCLVFCLLLCVLARRVIIRGLQQLRYGGNMLQLLMFLCMSKVLVLVSACLCSPLQCGTDVQQYMQCAVTALLEVKRDDTSMQYTVRPHPQPTPTRKQV